MGREEIGEPAWRGDFSEDNTMKRVAVFALLCALVASTPASAQELQFGNIRVYTRNLYIGTDFDAVLGARPEEFLDAARGAFAEIVATNFPLRAEALAKEIATIRPHLIGLQEVFNFTLDGVNSDLPFVNYLETLLTALAALGLDYQVAAVVNNIDLTFNCDLFECPPRAEKIGVLDRDVILARGDVDTRVAHFDCQHPSKDGCNYDTLLPLVLPPLLDTSVFRGFVGVDAVVNGETYRFVTTHLEVREAAGQTIPLIQRAQAAELVRTIEATPPKRPVILVGDFNSEPTDPAGSPYDIIRAAAYADTWKQNILKSRVSQGFTCCQDSDLNNDKSLLKDRVDIIFVKNNFGVLPFSLPGLVFSVVAGDEPIRNSQPKWSSDHAGPFALLLGIPLFEGHGSAHVAGRE
jgi:hypothetical protein